MGKSKVPDEGKSGTGKKMGRPPLLKEEHREVLRDIARERPQGTLEETTRELCRRAGITVCSVTVRKALREAGIAKVKPARVEVNASGTQPKRYGYTKAHRREGTMEHYPTDVTDAEWALIQDLFERPKGLRGMPVHHERRMMLNACCYVLRTGCAWRLLPKSYGSWATVYKTFSRWAKRGVFEAMQDRLREQWRVRIERNAAPTVAIIDSQATRGSPQGGGTGFDAAKKVKGRKRHLVVDTLGLLLAVVVTAASVQDRDGATTVVAQACAKVPSLKKLYADSAYAGRCAESLEQAHGIEVEIVRSPGNRLTGTYHDAQGSLWSESELPRFALPKRWVVERTHAWGERCRRLVMHHDRSSRIATAWVWLADAGILAARLAAPG